MAALCRVQTCTKPRTSRSLYCPHHASRHRRHGDPLGRAISTAELREARETMRAVMEKYAEGRAMKAARKILALLFEHARKKRRSARRKIGRVGVFRPGDLSRPDCRRGPRDHRGGLHPRLGTA